LDHFVSKNKVVFQSLQYLLDAAYLGAVGAISPWYLGLTGATPVPADADTALLHPGWTEFVNYSQPVRPTYTAVRAAQTMSNAAALAQFTITVGGTIGGAFMVSSNVKGGGAGTLHCCAPFSVGNRTVVPTDDVFLQYDCGAADDGVP
jgi:hypothetical protein